MLPLGFCIGTILGLKELAQERRENMTHKPDAVEWTEMHFINPHAKGVLCFCGADATHKVGEEIPRDDPYQNRHNFTQYVCCQCFVNIVGNAAFCGLTRDTAELDALRREVEAGKKIDGSTSDGYHTFDELYEYRKLYNAALFNEWWALRETLYGFQFNVHKSKRHSDGELCFGGGWFIVQATLPTGQISNHYKLDDWDLFKCEEREQADTYDGHSPSDVAIRLAQFLALEGESR